MVDFPSSSYSGGAEDRIQSLSRRIDQLENIGASRMPYDPNVARSNPVPNPSAMGTNVSPQQAQNFQAMMQMMQANMLSNGLNNRNDNNNNSALGSMMQSLGIQIPGTGVPGMQGMMPGGAIPGMQGIPQMNQIPGMPQQMMPGAMPQGMNPGMPQQNMGMQSVDPQLLQQMSQIQMLQNY